MSVAEQIKKIFEALPRNRSYRTMAEETGIARQTLYNVQKNAEGMTLRRLRKIMAATGHRVVITFEREEAE